MKQEITIILTKSSSCPHCKNFEPIYEKAKEIYESNNFLKNYVIKFEDYDMVNDSERNTFAINHNSIVNKIEGYPTVFISIKGTNNYDAIEHTIIDYKINEKNQQEDAAKRFLENIVNQLKTLKSDSKILYIQNGGSRSNTFTNETYKKKYLKYKFKYYELKKKSNLI